MSDEEDYSSDDDVDYVPTVGEEVSEEEGSGDEEDLDALNEDAKQDGKVGGRRERSKKKNDLAPRKRQGGIKLDGEEEPDDPPHGEPESWDLMQEIAKEKEAKKEKQEKKRADDLWSSFMSDMKTPPPRKTSSTGLGVLASMVKPTNINPKQSPSQATPESGITTSTKMTITKVFDFAGEEVKVTKEVDVTSREAQEEIKKQENSSAEAKSSTPSTSEKPSGLSGIGVKRPAAGAGGLGGLLNKIGKKPKMSVLVMKPMKTATTVMCDEQQPTLSVVYPLYSSLLKSTAPANCDDTDSRTIREMKRAMHEDLNHRYQSDVDVSLLHNAAAMDPRFKDLPFLSDVQRMTVFSKIAVEASHLVNIAACEEKSKMDWNTFKKDKGIEDDLQIHNRGKESYLERMAFLNRADVRQFEIEKSLRLSKSKR